MLGRQCGDRLSAIEFLLWGQDLNGTGAGAEARPAIDYSTAEHAERRGEYLQAASDLLVADLEEMVANWQPDGAARADLAETGLATILTGMGSLSFGEVAGRADETRAAAARSGRGA